MRLKFNEKKVKKYILLALALLVFVIICISIVNSFGMGHTNSSSTMLKEVVPTGKYYQYLKQYGYYGDDKEELIDVDEIVLDAKDATLDHGQENETYFAQGTSKHTSTYNTSDGNKATISQEYNDITYLDGSIALNPSEQVVVMGEAGSATWTFNVTKNGFYNILVDYVAEQKGGANIERKIMVDGKLPYDNLLNVSFQRVWGDGRDDSGNPLSAEKLIDINDNEIKPEQCEYFFRRLAYVKDSVGYVAEPYLIYLSAGSHTLTIEAVREAMTIYSVSLTPKVSYDSYETVKASWDAQGIRAVEMDTWTNTKIEGEDATYRSSATLYAVSDRSSKYNSTDTSEYADHVSIILNVIGGDKWSTSGDWISWEVNAPIEGLYKISLRCKQNTSRGLFSVRTVSINDEIQFAEAQNCKFKYSSNYSIVTLGNDTEDFYFYFKQGKNTITLEASLGDYGSEISSVQEIIDNLNAIYRNIIAITGTDPDSYINYHLTDKLPELFGEDGKFYQYADELREIAARITEISGEKSGETASLETMALQLEKFVKKPRNVQKNLSTFSTNISSLGTWIISVSEQTLTIDKLWVHTKDFDLPKANPNSFEALGFKTLAFIKSFFFDYQSIGTTEATQGYESVEVWLLTGGSAGREQGNAIRTLINSSFTNQHRINVDLKVVSSGVLLTATLAGRGPDVAINAGNGTPVEYAIRGATYDLSQFDDFNVETLYDKYGNKSFRVKVDGESESRWMDSAMTPYEFNGGFYALPNTSDFLVLFYRTDIFAAKGWEVPTTWMDAINLIPELQVQNLSFFLPLNSVGASSVVNQIFASRLYQTGGRFYRTAINSEGKEYMESNFDSEDAIKAFEFWCSFYTDYSFSLSVSGGTFINRFRTGEMPIGIASYETYNTLAVSAPEIRGKWTFALLPGTEQEDGTIDYTGATSGTSVMLMKNAKNPEGGWEFMKWWTNAETQINYAREIESILGAAARHPTANVEAFKQLSWTVEERDVLVKQWEHTVGVPEVAGGYYTGRNLENAFRYVVNNKTNPRETLDDYVRTINNEINRKRDEFGLGTSDDYY